MQQDFIGVKSRKAVWEVMRGDMKLKIISTGTIVTGNHAFAIICLKRMV